MNAFVIDENVPIVANDTVRPEPLAGHVDHACRLACVVELQSIVRTGVTVIDDNGQVLENYRRYLNHHGQPGVGDAFYKHVSDHQFNEQKVCRIALATDESGSFVAFPNHAALQNFDRSDRIYVVLALSTANGATILNAVDSDYSEHGQVLTTLGVRVKELCPNCIRSR